MQVFVVIREDQNDHGFVDTSVSGIYRRREEAEAYVTQWKADARADGLHVSGDDDDDWEEVDWEVHYKIEAHVLE